MKAEKVVSVIFYGLIAFAVVVVLFGIFRSQPNAAAPRQMTERPVAAASALISMVSSHNFGTISMAAGKVSHRYSISNTGKSAVTITKIYTSCMCTEATLVTQSGRKGPFGMPGHGADRGIFESIAPGGSAQVETVFDPAAHGPAGIGPTERTVTIRTADGAPLVLQFAAMVKP